MSLEVVEGRLKEISINMSLEKTLGFVMNERKKGNCFR